MLLHDTTYTPGSPSTACDGCGMECGELYFNEATEASLCEACDAIYQGETPNVQGRFRIIETMQNTWIVKTDVPNPGDHIYVADPNPGSMRGFGGARLVFYTVQGDSAGFTGPWHSNSKAFTKDTGIDLTGLHLTRVMLTSPTAGVVYMESEPVLGDFDRGKTLAENLSAALGDILKVDIESAGGSCSYHVGG